MSRMAASQFYKLLRAKNPAARARWSEILELARLGDPQAVRAVLLIQSVMRGPRFAGTGNVSPQRIEQLRQMIINARYSTPAFPPLAGQAGGASPASGLPPLAGFRTPV